jgi:EAL domain-containing protein (putative c-di-GMP-specific phosphodiesterase class I)
MFSILLRQTNVHEATQFGYDVLKRMESAFKVGNDNIEIGASMGIVVYPEDGESTTDLIRHADVSLHKAKSEGRNCIVVFSRELSESINRRAVISSCLKQAIYKDEFHLLYQPKVDLLTGKICGWEALLRWNSPSLGNVSPVEFIQVAEESGLILEIGDWVLRSACKQIKSWQEEGLCMGSVAVNLSARQFRQKDLVDKISTILQEENVKASDITLEITESAIMDNPSSTASMLEQLAILGIYTAIDDFGTGHSSLSYLKTFPIRTLKIDRSFIRDIPEDENDLAIVHSILSLGKSLGLSVVAEGVETQEQLDYLRMEKCGFIQGYLYSRPLPPKECAALIQSEIYI